MEETCPRCNLHESTAEREPRRIDINRRPPRGTQQEMPYSRQADCFVEVTDP